jgi:diguanylate cyclase (GGDEF)-like protein
LTAQRPPRYHPAPLWRPVGTRAQHSRRGGRAAADAGAGAGAGGWWWLLVAAAAAAVLSVFLPAASAQWLAAAGGAVTVAAAGYGLAIDWQLRGLGAALRHPMTMISAGLGLIVTGEALHAAGEPFPSSADVVSLAAYPLLLLGLVRLTRVRLREHPLDTLLVAAVAPVTLAAFGWLPLLSTLDRWMPDRGRPAWPSIAFLVVDGLAVAIVGRLTLLFRGKPIGYQFLLGAFAALLGAHLSRAAASVTDVVPAPFGSQTLLLVGFGLVGGAVLHPSLRQHGRTLARPAPIGSGYLLLMTAAVLIGPAVAIRQYAHLGSWVIFAIAGPALVALLVVAHLSRLLTERSRLEHASTHDALTGLPNRALFHDKVALALVDADRVAPFAVGFLDLDRFKKVNDSLGHDAGDELLCQVAERLCAATRQHDVVARLAGDEFALLLPGAGEQEANALAQRILESFANSFRVAGHSVVISPSVGLAIHPGHGTGADTLLRHADAAMYCAKTSGRNMVVCYHDRLGTRGEQQAAVQTALQRAISRDELVVHYQPKVNAATGELTGAEALVRWQHPRLGTIPPSAFIGLAEQTPVIARLGEWVLTSACSQVEAWLAAGREIPVSVNLSARQFQLQDVPDMVARALAGTGLPAHLLELELTESISLDEQDTVAATLDKLRALGVRCSVDDFGTGYSGLGYLQRYPVDTIKLDRTLVAAIGPGDAPLVRAAIVMAHSLGLRVIAEGVESPEQAAFLHAHGCDELQGYLISPPVPADQLSRLHLGAAGPGIVPPSHYLPYEPARPSAMKAGWTEEALGRSLLELQALAEAIPTVQGGGHRADAAHDTNARHVTRTLVLTATATGLLSLPVLLGLAASNALPPNAQRVVAEALGQLHATVPQPTTDHHAEPSTPTRARSRGGSGRRNPAHPAGDPTSSQPSAGPKAPHPSPDPTPSPSPDPTPSHPTSGPSRPHPSPHSPKQPHPSPHSPKQPHPSHSSKKPSADPMRAPKSPDPKPSHPTAG